MSPTIASKSNILIFKNNQIKSKKYGAKLKTLKKK